VAVADLDDVRNAIRAAATWLGKAGSRARTANDHAMVAAIGLAEVTLDDAIADLDDMIDIYSPWRNP
jgi:hypothetical protein